MRSLRKTLAGTLTLLFLFQELLYGALLTAQIPQTGSVHFPKALGQVEFFHRGSSGKTILFIQDAHDSIEAQLNIAGLIRHAVAHYGVKTVFEEGYEGPVPTDELYGALKESRMREAVSYYLLDHLRIGGAEYAHINRRSWSENREPLKQTKTNHEKRITNHDFRLIGADSFEGHFENVRWFQRAVKEKAPALKDLDFFITEFQRLADERFSKDAKIYLRLKQRFDAEKIDLWNYLKRARPLASQEASYPTIDLLLKAGQLDRPGTRESIAKIEARSLFEELRQMDNAIEKNIFQKTDPFYGQRIFSSLKHLSGMKRLLDFKMTPAELDSVKQGLLEFDTQAMAQFLVQETRRSMAFSKTWEQSVRDAVQFYESAVKRETAAETQLSRFLKHSPEKTAVLVYGGFHRQGLENLFDRSGVSYAVISPKLSGEETHHRKLYRKLMEKGYELNPSAADHQPRESSRIVPAAIPADLPQAARLISELELVRVAPAAGRDQLRQFHQRLQNAARHVLRQAEGRQEPSAYLSALIGRQLKSEAARLADLRRSEVRQPEEMPLADAETGGLLKTRAVSSGLPLKIPENLKKSALKQVPRLANTADWEGKLGAIRTALSVSDSEMLEFFRAFPLVITYTPGILKRKWFILKTLIPENSTPKRWEGLRAIVSLNTEALEMIWKEAQTQKKVIEDYNHLRRLFSQVEQEVRKTKGKTVAGFLKDEKGLRRGFVSDKKYSEKTPESGLKPLVMAVVSQLAKRSEVRMESRPVFISQEETDVFFEKARVVMASLPQDFGYQNTLGYEFVTAEQAARHLGDPTDETNQAVAKIYRERGWMMGSESVEHEAKPRPVHTRVYWIDPTNPDFRFGSLLENLKRGFEALAGVYDQRDTEQAIALMEELMSGVPASPKAKTTGLADFEAWRGLVDDTLALDHQLTHRSEVRSVPMDSEKNSSDDLKKHLLEYMSAVDVNTRNKKTNELREFVVHGNTKIQREFKKLLSDLLSNEHERAALKVLGSALRETDAGQRARLRRLFEHFFDTRGRYRKEVPVLSVETASAAPTVVEADTWMVKIGKKEVRLSLERVTSPLSDADVEQLQKIFNPYNTLTLLSQMRQPGFLWKDHIFHVLRNKEKQIAAYAWAHLNQADKVLGLGAIGVAEQYRKQGVAAWLRQKQMEIGLRQGMQSVRTHVAWDGRRNGWHWSLLKLGFYISALRFTGMDSMFEGTANKALREVLFGTEQQTQLKQKAAIEKVLKQFPEASLVMGMTLSYGSLSHFKRVFEQTRIRRSEVRVSDTLRGDGDWSDLAWVTKLTSEEKRQLRFGREGQAGFHLNGWRFNQQAAPGIEGFLQGLPRFLKEDPLAVKWHAEDQSEAHQPFWNDFYDHFQLEFKDAAWAEPLIQTLEQLWELGGSRREQTARLAAYLKFTAMAADDTLWPTHAPSAAEAVSALRWFIKKYSDFGMRYDNPEQTVFDERLLAAAERALVLGGLKDFEKVFEDQWNTSQQPAEPDPPEIERMAADYDALMGRSHERRTERARHVFMGSSLVLRFGEGKDLFRLNFGSILGHGRVYKDSLVPGREKGSDFLTRTLISADQKQVLMLGYRKHSDDLWIYLPKTDTYKRYPLKGRRNLIPSDLSAIPEIVGFQDSVVRGFYDQASHRKTFLTEAFAKEGYVWQPEKRSQMVFSKQRFKLSLPSLKGSRTDWFYLRAALPRKPGFQPDVIVPWLRLADKQQLLQETGLEYFMFVPLTQKVALYGQSGLLRVLDGEQKLNYDKIPELKEAFQNGPSPLKRSEVRTAASLTKGEAQRLTPTYASTSPLKPGEVTIRRQAENTRSEVRVEAGEIKSVKPALHINHDHWVEAMRYPELYEMLMNLEPPLSAKPLQVLVLGPGRKRLANAGKAHAHSPQMVEILAALSGKQAEYTVVDGDPYVLRAAVHPQWYQLNGYEYSKASEMFKKRLRAALGVTRRKIITRFQTGDHVFRVSPDLLKELQVKPIRSLFESMRFDSGSYDVIIGTMSLVYALASFETMEGALDYLADMIRSVKPGGKIFLDHRATQVGLRQRGNAETGITSERKDDYPVWEARGSTADSAPESFQQRVLFELKQRLDFPVTIAEHGQIQILTIPSKKRSEVRMISDYQLRETFGGALIGPILSGGRNEDFLYENGRKVAVHMPWGKFVFRALDAQEKEIPDRVYKITHYASDNRMLFEEARLLFKLQQDSPVQGVPRLARIGMMDLKKSGGMWIEQQGLRDARSLDREIFGRAPRLFEVLIQAGEIIKQVHAKGVIHADLKPAQFLINNAQELQLIDFGNAREKGSLENRDNYTTGYVPIDQDGQPLTTGLAEDTDVYSFVMMIAELVGHQIQSKSAKESSLEPLFQRMRDDYLKLILKEWNFNYVQELWLPTTNKIEITALPRKKWPQSMDIILKKLQDDLVLIQKALSRYEVRTPKAGALADQTQRLRERFIAGESLNALQAEAFALFSKAAELVLGQTPSPQQEQAARELHAGKAVEMLPGEGKTLAIAMTSYLHALTGRGVHIHTFNRVLAKRDFGVMAPVFDALGMTSGALSETEESYVWDAATGQGAAVTGSEGPQKAYQTDILYGPKDQFVFDYLSDSLAESMEQRRRRLEPPSLVVVDEGDSVMLDEAYQPLIISRPDRISREKLTSNEYAVFYEESLDLKANQDYRIDPVQETVELLTPAVGKINYLLRAKGFNALKQERLNASGALRLLIQQAVAAREFDKKGEDYIVADGRVILVDAFTGELKHQHVFAKHRHQFVAAKEKRSGATIRIPPAVAILNTMTYQSYYLEVRENSTLAMATGTMGNDGAEIKEVYGLDPARISEQFDGRLQEHTEIFETQDEKKKALLALVLEKNREGLPLLIFAPTILAAQELKKRLDSSKKLKPDTVTLIDGSDEKQAALDVLNVGQLGRVTVATPIVGRGVNIPVAENVLQQGGLAVVLTERGLSERSDDQLKLRTARRGRPGSLYRFFSKEDEGLRRFATQKESERHLKELRSQAYVFDRILDPYRRRYFNERAAFVSGNLTADDKLSILLQADESWSRYLTALEDLKSRGDLQGYRAYAQKGFKKALRALIRKTAGPGRGWKGLAEDSDRTLQELKDPELWKAVTRKNWQIIEHYYALDQTRVAESAEQVLQGLRKAGVVSGAMTARGLIKRRYKAVRDLAAARKGSDRIAEKLNVSADQITEAVIDTLPPIQRKVLSLTYGLKEHTVKRKRFFYETLAAAGIVRSGNQLYTRGMVLRAHNRGLENIKRILQGRITVEEELKLQQKQHLHGGFPMMREIPSDIGVSHEELLQVVLAENTEAPPEMTEKILKLRAVWFGLSPVERVVLKAAFGLGEPRAGSLDEIAVKAARALSRGAKEKMTRPRVASHRKDALEALKHRITGEKRLRQELGIPDYENLTAELSTRLSEKQAAVLRYDYGLGVLRTANQTEIKERTGLPNEQKVRDVKRGALTRLKRQFVSEGKAAPEVLTQRKKSMSRRKNTRVSKWNEETIAKVIQSLTDEQLNVASMIKLGYKRMMAVANESFGPNWDNTLRHFNRDPVKIRKKGKLRSEVRRQRVENGRPEKIENMTVPAGVFLDVRELSQIPEAQSAQQMKELMALLSRHSHFDLYIEGDPSPIRNGAFRKLMEQYRRRIHLGKFDRAGLTKKKILVRVSFLQKQGTFEETQKSLQQLKDDYQLTQEVTPLEYTQAGALKGFLDLAESLKPGELIRKLTAIYGVRNASGYIRLENDFLASLWHDLQSTYVFQWSA